MEMFYGPEMLVTLRNDLQQMWQSFDMLQYCIDHSELVDILCERLKHGKVKGRLILDKSMFFRTSPWSQPFRTAIKPGSKTRQIAMRNSNVSGCATGLPTTAGHHHAARILPGNGGRLNSRSDAFWPGLLPFMAMGLRFATDPCL